MLQSRQRERKPAQTGRPGVQVVQTVVARLARRTDAQGRQNPLPVRSSGDGWRRRIGASELRLKNRESVSQIALKWSLCSWERNCLSSRHCGSRRRPPDRQGSQVPTIWTSQQWRGAMIAELAVSGRRGVGLLSGLWYPSGPKVTAASATRPRTALPFFRPMGFLDLLHRGPPSVIATRRTSTPVISSEAGTLLVRRQKIRLFLAI